MTLQNWKSYKEGPNPYDPIDYDYTGIVHIVSPEIHTRILYSDGLPQFVCFHHLDSDNVTIEAWSPYDQTFITSEKEN